MKTKTLDIVYLNPTNESELETLHGLLAPYSWADGEFGLMLTDAAFEECVESLPKRTAKAVKEFLKGALNKVRKSSAGDVCLNFGLYR